MFAALVLSVAGVPGNLAYNAAGPGNQNHYTGNDPIGTLNSIDGNVKYVNAKASTDPGGMNFYFNGIDKSEQYIPATAQSVADLTGSVMALDAQLGNVKATTIAMKQHLGAMANTSDGATRTMTGLDRSITGLGGQMTQLQDSTLQLSAAMAKITAAAKQIADKRTGVALADTKSLGAALPAQVPPANVSMQPVPQGPPPGGIQ
jgi:hypothetical protein